MPSAISILQDLIALPSVNPDGEPGTTATGEADCAAWVADFLTQLGAEVVLEEVLPGRPNVIGRFPAKRSGVPKIVLGPHLDTVSVAGMTIDPFGAENRDGRIWGRGASDTKGTAAAMLEALRQLGSAAFDLNAEVTFVGFMGEESAQYGSKHFAKHHLGYDFALVGEPTECRVVNTHKGCLWAEISTSGKAVHGSTPELGENAIMKMLPIISQVDGPLRRWLASPEFSHSMLGSSTVNIGMIRGGSRTNIVPDQCKLSLDFRYTPTLHALGFDSLVQQQLTEVLRECGAEFHSHGSCAPLDTPADNPFVKKLAAIDNGVTGAPWFCDAAWLAAAGIPSVAAGPGSIAQAHTADEWIRIRDLEDGVDFYRTFLETI
jgi:acetylornithine deacetylase/succinyl-diaminopimelate desuccinylase family protein